MTKRPPQPTTLAETPLSSHRRRFGVGSCLSVTAVLAVMAVSAPADAQMAVDSGAVAAGAGLPMVGGLGRTSSSGAAGAMATAAMPVTGQGTPLRTLGGLGGGLGAGAPSAVPGDVRLDPIDTSRLTAPSAPAAPVPSGGAAPVFPSSVPVPAIPAAVPASSLMPAYAAPTTTTTTTSPAAASGTSDPAYRPVSVPARAGVVPPPAPPPAAPSGPQLQGDRTMVSADELTRDEALGMVTARGNVQVVSEGRVLNADVVTYNTVQDMVTASGNVVMRELNNPQADTTFANYVELTGDLKNGFIRGAQLLMANGARMAAGYGERDGDGQSKEFSKGVYTACKSCSGEENPLPTLTGQRNGPRQPPPAWQVKAGRITHDEESKDLIYRDAWLEIYGIPVIYSPYLSTPDPTVYRRSGLLTPATGASDTLGAMIHVPYYIVWDDHADSTVALLYSELEGPVGLASYARELSIGRFSIDGSAHRIPGGGFDGHIQTDGELHLNRTFRAGLTSALTTDPAYLRLFDLKPQGEEDTYLTTNPYLHAYRNRSFAALESLYFQDLRDNVDNDAPYAIPYSQASFVSDPLWKGGHLEADMNTLVLRHPTSADSNRLIGEAKYVQPFLDGYGGEWELVADLRGDMYLIDNATDSTGQDTSVMRTRLFPRGALTWRYPLVRPGKMVRQVIEPKVGVVVAPPANNPSVIPDQDTGLFQLDTSNLFDLSRAPGYDRVEGGQWTNYGLSYDLYGTKGDRLSLAVGQSYRFQKDTDLFKEGSGLSDKLSDVVASVVYVPSNHMVFDYSTQIDPKTWEPRRHQVRVSGGNERIGGGVAYQFVDAYSSGSDNLPLREELATSLRVKLSDYWQVAASNTYNLVNNVSDATSLRVTYEDECLLVTGLIENDDTSVFGVSRGLSVLLTFTLKTLGTYSYSPSLFSDDEDEVDN